MRLTGRVVKLEARWTAAAPKDEDDVQLWEHLFASARRRPEDRETTEDHILEVDRRVAREFFAYCRSTEEKPTIAALNKWAHCETEG